MPNLSAFSQGIAPLSIGYVIHATLRLYRDNFLVYFKLIIRVFFLLITLMIPPVLIIINSPLLLFVQTPFVQNPLILLWIVFYFYCVAKFYKNCALVSRMAYRLLINQPETLEEVAYKVSGLWIFLWVNLLINLIFAIVQPFGNRITDALTIDKGIFINISLLFVQTFLYFWFIARFYLYDVILAVEPTTGINAIKRSWQLTRGVSIKILLVILVSFLIILPAYLIALIAGIPFFLFLIFTYIIGLAPTLLLENAWIINNPILLTVSLVALVLVLLLTIPYWQVLKAVIYYDLHNRSS